MKLSIDIRYYVVISFMTVSLFNIPIIGADSNVSVDLRVEGEGFHRTLVYEIDTGNFTKHECNVALHLLLPPALYVNIDELANLQRIGKSVACSVGEIDVELFAEKAKPQNVTICTPLISSKILLTLEVHERYQFARESGGYVDVILSKPKLLLGCKDRIKEYRVSKVDLCSPCVDLTLKWREIPYKMETKDYIWQAPVGDLSQQGPVTYITLLLTGLGAIVIIKTILQPEDKRTKEK